MEQPLILRRLRHQYDAIGGSRASLRARQRLRASKRRRGLLPGPSAASRQRADEGPLSGKQDHDASKSQPVTPATEGDAKAADCASSDNNTFDAAAASTGPGPVDDIVAGAGVDVGAGALAPTAEAAAPTPSAMESSGADNDDSAFRFEPAALLERVQRPSATARIKRVHRAVVLLQVPVDVVHASEKAAAAEEAPGNATLTSTPRTPAPSNTIRGADEEYIVECHGLLVKPQGVVNTLPALCVLCPASVVPTQAVANRVRVVSTTFVHDTTGEMGGGGSQQVAAVMTHCLPDTSVCNTKLGYTLVGVAASPRFVAQVEPIDLAAEVLSQHSDSALASGMAGRDTSTGEAEVLALANDGNAGSVGGARVTGVAMAAARTLAGDPYVLLRFVCLSL